MLTGDDEAVNFVAAGSSAVDQWGWHECGSAVLNASTTTGRADAYNVGQHDFRFVSRDYTQFVGSSAVPAGNGTTLLAAVSVHEDQSAFGLSNILEALTTQATGELGRIRLYVNHNSDNFACTTNAGGGSLRAGTDFADLATAPAGAPVWHVIACAYDAVTGNVHMYMDGDNVTTTVDTPSAGGTVSGGAFDFNLMRQTQNPLRTDILGAYIFPWAITPEMDAMEDLVAAVLAAAAAPPALQPPPQPPPAPPSGCPDLGAPPNVSLASNSSAQDGAQQAGRNAQAHVSRTFQAGP